MAYAISERQISAFQGYLQLPGHPFTVQYDGAMLGIMEIIKNMACSLPAVVQKLADDTATY